MNILTIPKLSLQNSSLPDLSHYISEKGGREMIRCNNWDSKEFPEIPILSFNSSFSETSLFIHFYVCEDPKNVTITKKEDTEPVYEDSCVEAFISLDNKKSYFNFEFNSKGICLGAYGTNREDRDFFTKDKLHCIQRFYKSEFDTKGSNFQLWKLLVSIPWNLLNTTYDKIIKNESVYANFYKCGDKTPSPHYLSWAPIKTDKPDFHRPEFFQKITFDSNTLL